MPLSKLDGRLSFFASIILSAMINMVGISFAWAGSLVDTQQGVAANTEPAVAPMTPVVVTPDVEATVYPGSLKDNITRIAQQFGWNQVVWNVPNDYRWVGTVKVHGKDFYIILMQVLKDYPVQAIFYEGNHVLVITPR